MNPNLESRLKEISQKTEQKGKKRKTSRFSHINPELVVELLQQGWRLPQIANIYGCSPLTVTRQVKFSIPNFDARKLVRLGMYDINNDDVVELYAATKSSTKIARQLGVNTHTITRRLEKKGIKRRSLYREDIKIEDVVPSYKILRSVPKVAKIFNTNNTLIRNRLLQGGITQQEIIENVTRTKSARKRADIPKTDVLTRYEKKESISSIAKDYNASYTTIKRIINTHSF